MDETRHVTADPQLAGPSSEVTGPSSRPAGTSARHSACAYFAAGAADRETTPRTELPSASRCTRELRLGDAGNPRAALMKALAAGVTVSLSIDATSLASVNLFEAMNVAWNTEIPWRGTDTQDLAPANVPSVHRDGDDQRRSGARAGRRHRLADSREACRPHHDPCPRPQRGASCGCRVGDRAVADARQHRHGVHRRPHPEVARPLGPFDVDQVIQNAELSPHQVRTRAGGGLDPPGPTPATDEDGLLRP